MKDDILSKMGVPSIGDHFFSLGAQYGDPEASRAIQPVVDAIKVACWKHLNGGYDTEITSFAPVVRGDGSLTAWHFKGTQRHRIFRKLAYLTFDVGVPEELWRNMTKPALCDYLVNALGEGFEIAIAKLLNRGSKINVGQFRKDWKHAKEAILMWKESKPQ